jgi:hypothetical protein
MTSNETNTTGDKQQSTKTKTISDANSPATNGGIVVSPIIDVNKPGYRTANIAKAREAKRRRSNTILEEPVPKKLKIEDEEPIRTNVDNEDEEEDNDDSVVLARASSSGTIRDHFGNIISISSRLFFACIVAGAVSYVRATLDSRQNTSENSTDLRRRWTQ